jgi:hypothetical protein
MAKQRRVPRYERQSETERREQELLAKERRRIHALEEARERAELGMAPPRNGEGQIVADLSQQAPNNSYGPPLFYADQEFACVWM